MQKNDTRSLLAFLSSMVIYGSIGIFRRWIPLSSALLACFRGASGSLLLLLVSVLQRHRLRNGTGRKKILLLVLSGSLMGLNWILLFEAYHYTTVSTATLCYYMQPTIVMLLSPFFFQEKLTARNAVCALAAIIGMVFISGMPENGIPAPAEAKGILFGLGAAALYAAVVILNKKLPGIDAYEKTIIQLASAAAVLLPYVLLTQQGAEAEITPMVIVMLLIVGFVHTGLAYILYFGSIDGLRAQTVAILSYLDPITALFLSAVLLHEKMTPLALLGAVLIIGAAVISELGRAGASEG